MRILLTGATGFLGSELAPKLRAKGHIVYGLSRHGPDLVGDITQHNLGLKHLPKVDAVFHSAALVSFSEKDRANLFEINSKGTRNVCNFCLNHGIKRLFYVSTAYICGDHKGEFGEEDFRVAFGQGFKNPYEESKYWAEAYVREFAKGFNLHPPVETTIFRPSIIVGDSRDGRAARFEAFYEPLKAMASVERTVERFGLPPRVEVQDRLHRTLWLPIRIRGDPDATLNIVPVDWVSQKMADLTDAPPRAYHLTNPSPPTLSLIAEAVCEALAIRGPHFKQRFFPTPLDTFYNRLIRQLLPYLGGEPMLASSVNWDCPRMDKPDIMRLVEYWKEQST